MLYLYAICNTSVPGPWPDAVTPGPVTAEPLAGNWYAIVSEVDAAFVADCGAESRQRDLSWIGPRALRHEAVVEHAHNYSGVIPARFGTLFSSQDALRDWVRQNAASLTDVFATLRGAEEWGISAELLPVNAEEANSIDLVERNSPGRGYLAAALRRKQAESRRTELWDETTAALSRRLAEISRAATERRPGTWAYLVPRENRQIFALAAEEFSRPELGLRFKLSGPWPPYSFVREFPQGHRAGSFEASSTQGGVGVRGQTASAVQA